MRARNLALLLIVIGVLFSSPLHAQATKNFFEGKSMAFLVGSTAGGGSDLTGRLVARHLERHIPGKPRIDVINKPGAGGMIAMNELYNLRKPDGLSIALMNTSALFATAGGNEAIKFELQKFIFVGQAFDDAQTLYLRSATPYTSFDAIRKANKEGKLPKMGAQSLDHTSNVVVKIVGHILDLEFHVIPGYPGTPQILLDIERGALDGRAQSTGSLFATKREWLKNGFVKPLLTSRKIRDPRLPELPSIEELAPAGSKGLLNALYSAQNVSRAVALAPGVPPDRVKILRDAFAAMTKDEQFLKESEKMGLEISLTRGEDMNRDVETTIRDKRLMEMYRTIALVK
ncbi:MAG TPA: tripartite tricarboxylate transporter substrate-binding protein [Candidatus Binatia bacterium]|nr:tripartite tricarboxylate transporter substrate-binding protein [Candidatus Binatia bacterium]